MKKYLSKGCGSSLGNILSCSLGLRISIRCSLIPNVVKAWITLSRLSRFLYKLKILEEIGGIIGKVSKINFNTDSRMIGKFTRMAVYVNLDKPLIS
ncbi:hypothetical protein J1N35_008599 [Gossypium stocksii]|uniref:Uncharacterized protein n=1 Tax=Gossypium stocksii TaxID=47602 RepID=A0A9D3W8Q6_9ROSI|nr:hypothetical protein J1N35_008599 [Gossypium stocksii]